MIIARGYLVLDIGQTRKARPPFNVELNTRAR